MKINRILWIVAAIFGLAIGIYPIVYFINDEPIGLLLQKPAALIQANFWQAAFAGHIVFGGISLLTGWMQFRARWRRNITFHRRVGIVYLGVSGLCAVLLAIYAEGGWIAKMGFLLLGLSWLFTTTRAYVLIRAGKLRRHGEWMIRSYALTFAAVMLRIWMPLFLAGFGLPFAEAYPVVAWLCWVPNVFVGEWIIARKRSLQTAV